MIKSTFNRHTGEWEHKLVNPPSEADQLRAEVARLTAELAAIRTGDTCGRQCEGTAYRITARTLKVENERLTAELDGWRGKAVHLQSLLEGAKCRVTDLASELDAAKEWNERYAIELRELREQEPVGSFRPNDYHGWQQVADEFANDADVTKLYARPVPAAQEVPAGYILVPIEQTPEMLEAAHLSDQEYTLRNFGDIMTVMQGPYDHWCAMVRSAPQPPADLFPGVRNMIEKGAQ